MTRMKRSMAGMISLAMVFMLLSACSSSNGSGDSSDKGGASSSEVSSSPGAVNDVIREPYEIVLAAPSALAEPKDLALVQKEINKITQAKINATVKIMVVPFSNWQQQMNLMLSSGEKLDLMVTIGAPAYAAQALKGQLTPLDDLIGKYGKGIQSALEPAYLNAPRVKGKVYGIPSIRNFATNTGFMMRKDLVDKYKIDIAAIKTLADVEKVLKTIKDNEPDLAPIVPAVGGDYGMLLGYNNRDSLGDDYGVLMDYNSLKVTNYYETPEYAELLKTLRRWYKSGYILKDAATNQITGNQLVKAGKAFGYITNMKPGYDAQQSITAGTAMVSVEIKPPVSTTTDVTSIMWAIPQNSKNPERAMMLLNMLYSDKDLVNLFDWGIEGKHYQKVADNVIDFAAGVDTKNIGYAPNWDFMMGNQFLSYVFNGNAPDIWKTTAQFNTNSTKSKALGFNFNPEAVKTEYTSLENIKKQYLNGLNTGTLDPDKTLPEFIAKLKSAGIDKVIAEKQKQLDEWAKINHIQ
ncbi:ABC transporter substrate-binding protein [Paenibacillus sp. LjRoot56]|uniref:ABC transporter substrate-binding protein n=1 Tax=Paenibacillus sp. LjRoot56 TaxID=3342333 RepID=UPI003F504E20